MPGEVVVAEAVQARAEHGLSEGVMLQRQGPPAQPRDGGADSQQAAVPDLVPVRAQRPEVATGDLPRLPPGRSRAIPVVMK
jgi:hypothetical protein